MHPVLFGRILAAAQRGKLQRAELPVAVARRDPGQGRRRRPARALRPPEPPAGRAGKGGRRGAFRRRRPAAGHNSAKRRQPPGDRPRRRHVTIARVVPLAVDAKAADHAGNLARAPQFSASLTLPNCLFTLSYADCGAAISRLSHTVPGDSFSGHGERPPGNGLAPLKGAIHSGTIEPTRLTFSRSPGRGAERELAEEQRGRWPLARIRVCRSR